MTPNTTPSQIDSENSEDLNPFHSVILEFPIELADGSVWTFTEKRLQALGETEALATARHAGARWNCLPGLEPGRHPSPPTPLRNMRTPP
jgi:hypothetical protein